MTCVSVSNKIYVCSNLLSFEMSIPCLFSNLVFKSAIFKELPEVHEVVKVGNCPSFHIALESALIADKAT